MYRLLVFRIDGAVYEYDDYASKEDAITQILELVRDDIEASDSNSDTYEIVTL